ncbi:MAG: AMP-binding protein, partial [Nitrospinae bacterium]|nr:AMP-binding protein [Nitrospinota bacterium]
MSGGNKIESMMNEERVINPFEQISKKAYMGSLEQYKKEYARSIADPEAYWAEKAGELDWIKKWDRVLDYNFNTPDIKWFSGGKLNVSANCLDRHIKNGRKNKAAIIWEGDDEKSTRVLTYQDVYRDVNRFALALKSHGVKKGDRVAIYMPMIPELAIAMLACARIGAPHSIVFGGFSSESLKNRIADSRPEVLITADGGFRGGKIVALKAIADQAV